MAITDTSDIINPTVAHRFRLLQSLNLQECVDTSYLRITTVKCIIQDLFEYYVTSLKYYVIIGNGQVWMFELLTCHCLVCVENTFHVRLTLS